MKPALFRTTFIYCMMMAAMSAAAQKMLPAINAYNEAFPHEKMYIHFDKAAYHPGETIWFKAYLKSYNFPSALSTNLYTELINNKGIIVQKKVHPIIQSSAAGSFDLTALTEKENLIFRAYTTTMLQNDTDFLYVKAIQINPEEARKTEPSASVLHFFPEGGWLLNGFTSTLAFKATDAFGYPVAASGVIKEGNKIITPFFTTHDGMGKIKMEPEAGKTYYAEWKQENGQMVKTPLPAAHTEGALLEVSQSRHSILYVVKHSAAVPENYKRIHVVAQMHQQVIYHAAIDMEEVPVTSGIIKADSLTTGILQLTLFTNDWLPLAEPNIFVNKDDFKTAAIVQVTKKNLAFRGLNNIEVEIPDTLAANLSISITDGALVPDDNNIISQFLLTADLKGYIHHPAYYFSNPWDSVKNQLDLVMLTHGWRRYNWKDLAAGKLPQIKYVAEPYLTIKGKVLGTTTTELAANPSINLVIQTKDSVRRFLAADLNKDGSFALGGTIFFDTAQVFYSFNKGSRLNKSATVNFLPTVPNHGYLGINAAQILGSLISRQASSRVAFFAQKNIELAPQKARKTIMLQEVVVETKAKSRTQELDKKYASGLFQSGNSRSFNLVDDPYANTTLNALTYLEGKVPGLQINSTDGTFTILRRSDAPELFLDEMPAEVDEIASVPVSDIAYIKVFDPPFLGAFGNGPGGAIAVYRKMGSDEKRNVKGLSNTRLSGYAPVKEFYSPDYASPSPLHELEDIRSTLYWNPFLLTDKNNRKVKLSFYNNDVSTSYRIVLEGMNELGKLIRVEKLIE